MNDKGLDVMEKILQCKHVTAISSEKALELIAEVNRLTSKNKTIWEIAEEQEVDITECRNENQRLLKESQLYKELYTKVNTQNMVYTMALEKIKSIHGGQLIDQIIEMQNIAKKSLGGKAK